MKIKQMVRISLSTAMMCVFVFLTSKFPFSLTVFTIDMPITLQTFFVMLIGCLLPPREAFISVLLYVIIGLIGLPVFSGLSSGIGAIISPKGGFILAFPVVAFIISFFKGTSNNFLRFLLVNLIFGIGLIYILGTIQISLFTKAPYFTILSSMLVFIPIDIVKALLATIISKKLIKLIN